MSRHDFTMANKRLQNTNRTRPDIFAWSGKYRVGIAKVDQQHKKLVTLINALARQHTEQAKPAVLVKVLDELASYTNYHFKTEESLMREYGVDAEFQIGHQQAHASFIQEVERATVLAQRNPQAISTRTLTFLSRWLIQHILGTDMRMANEIIALEKGLTPQEARDRAISQVADSNEVLLGAMGELYENLAVRTQEYLQANQQLKSELAFHQHAESQLRTLSVAIEHSPVSTFITDANGVFEYVNPKFVELTGYTMDDVRGKTPRMLKSGDAPDEIYAAMWESISAGKGWFGEFHNRRRNGESYWDRVSVTPIIDGHGAVTHFLAIQEDITDQKVAKEQLIRSHAQLAAATSALDEQARDLSILNQTTELLQNSLSASEAYRAVAYMAEQLALGAGGALLVMAEGDSRLTKVATWGGGPGLPDSFPSECCWAMRRGQAHAVRDPEAGPICDHFLAPPTTPYVCLPLLLKGRLLGLLHVGTGGTVEEARWQRLTRVGTALGNAIKPVLGKLLPLDAN